MNLYKMYQGSASWYVAAPCLLDAIQKWKHYRTSENDPERVESMGLVIT